MTVEPMRDVPEKRSWSKYAGLAKKIKELFATETHLKVTPPEGEKPQQFIVNLRTVLRIDIKTQLHRNDETNEIDYYVISKREDLEE